MRAVLIFITSKWCPRFSNASHSHSEYFVALSVAASNAKGAGSSEISSCNYLARAKGLKAGMFMMQAKKLCPELVVLR